MIPVVIILIAWWAGSGVVASVKAARASGPTPRPAGGAAAGSKSAAASNPAAPKGTPTSKTGPALGPGDVTFGQWQRSLYRRWKTKARAHLPGQHLGRKLADLFGDVTAASLAGAAIFGMGFVSGTTWTAKKRSARNAQTKTKRPNTPTNVTTPNGNPRRPRQPRPGTPTGGIPGFRSRRRNAQNPPRYTTGASEANVIDAELTDDIQAPTTAPSQFASNEYADVVLPALPSHPTASITAPNGHAMAAEILTIHDLFRWAKDAFTYAANAVEQSTVRANSAIERTSHALVRSSSATTRAEKASTTADAAIQHATHLEETAARFSVLRMDAASMSSIGVGITTAVGLAQTERRKAEAQAAVAAIAASLAAAEQAAAEAEQASAQAAILHAEAVKNMHDTVQLHQGPHAEAQSMTGNAAAHESVLAVN